MIKEKLISLDIQPNDTILVHGNAGIASQFYYKNDIDPIEGFFSELSSYLGRGTILVPCFSYSATKGEVFDVNETPSDVGMFSEKFRLLDGVKRSHHPIFSVCALGEGADDFINATIDDCFGEGTFFDLVYQRNVKILTLGCALERVTFVHFVEQVFNVPYRYLKTFPAQVHFSGTQREFNVSYFVRDLKIGAELNLSEFERQALINNKMRIEPFGRFKARNISAKDFFQVAHNLLKKNKYALVKVLVP